jgi:glycerophosphoryl diester phosphodiesterase
MLATPAQAQMPTPQWKSLDAEQRQFLLDAFQLAPEIRQTFSDAVPDDIKQNMLNTLWGVLTPEKRVQVALYAHIEKPWGTQSESTSRVLAPQWSKLTPLQKTRVYEAAHLDGGQRAIFEGLPAEIRQGAFDALWSYMDPKARQRVLAP